MKPELKITPMRSYPVPEYPTKQAVCRDPAVLQAVPARWRAKPAVCFALMLTLSTGLYACAGIDPADGTGPPSSSLSSTKNSQTTTTSSSKKPLPMNLKVPVFEHGAGRGSFGCVSVAPPVFLSEEEALQVIREEAAKKGVRFDGSRSIHGSWFPATNLYYGDKGELSTWKGTLELDGYDPALGIGFEFVSQEDVIAWANKTSQYYSTVESYDMKGTSERLAKVLDNTAVFYDPAMDFEAFNLKEAYGDKDYETYRKRFTAEQKERMRADLREQVRDFLAWLAAEGII